MLTNFSALSHNGEKSEKFGPVTLTSDLEIPQGSCGFKVHLHAQFHQAKCSGSSVIG